MKKPMFKCPRCKGLKERPGKCNLCGKLPLVEPGALSGRSGEGAVTPARSKLRAQAVEQQPRFSRSVHQEPKTP